MAGAKDQHLPAGKPRCPANTKSASWEEWPYAGLLGSPKHPLVDRPTKANHRASWRWKHRPNCDLEWSRGDWAFYLSKGRISPEADVSIPVPLCLALQLELSTSGAHVWVVCILRSLHHTRSGLEQGLGNVCSSEDLRAKDGTCPVLCYAPLNWLS